MEKENALLPKSSEQKLNLGRIIPMSLLGLAVIALVLVCIFAPDAKFNYLFGETSWMLILIIVVLVLIFIVAYYYDDKRDSKIYLTSSGDLDISTPRCYTPMKVNVISKILGRANIFGQKNLDEFRFADGQLYIRNSAGDEVEGPLESLTFFYKMDKNKATDEWYIYQYRIKDAKGNKVQFNQHSSMFNDEEYSDMEMILSLCGTVEESKISKFSKHLDNVLANVQELNFDNLVGSTSDMAIEKVSDAAMNSIGKLARAKLITEGTPSGKESTFKKILKYGLYVIIGLYVLAVIVVNVEPLFSSSATEEEYVDITEEESQSNPKNWDAFAALAGEDTYECVFYDSGQTFYLSIIPETGRGAYLAPSGNLYELTVELENDDRTMFELRANKVSGEPTKIVFYIQLDEYMTEVIGHMLGTDGETVYEFSGSQILLL